jgi:hypothetical protein
VWDVVERKDCECPSITFQYDSKDGEEGNVTNIFVSTAKLFHTFQDTMAMLLWSNAFSSLGHHSKT